MFRSRSWFGGGLWKPKNPHSLEHLKYLYNVLSKNQTVSETNRSLLVETLRSIAEILIWGDQNDSTVFDFFLEKNMLSFFLKIMKQKCGSYVCVQLLQTLNILFENIRNETSLYYLLSNNHVNSIIVHKFDFSDEEVMAYYISFLKTLSLKLNSHTIHFFYNEHTHDFPLYTEAIKFFNNGEGMVRIAVRTLTLNVYRVRDKSMLKFIRDKTAAPYFSNLVWFIGNHVLELNTCIIDNADHAARPRLADLVAEHLDHLHYLNDILCLSIDDLNQVLTEHLLHRLFVPLYITSLDRGTIVAVKTPPSPRVCKILALFLLSQVFLIMTHAPLVRVLASIILNGNERIFEFQPEVFCPAIPLTVAKIVTVTNCSPDETDSSPSRASNLKTKETENTMAVSPVDSLIDHSKSMEAFLACEPFVLDLSQRPFLSSVLESLDLVENDYAALFSLGLLHALFDNSGINVALLNDFFRANDTQVRTSSDDLEVKPEKYNKLLADKLIAIVGFTVKYESKVRVVTLQLVISLLLKTVMNEDGTSCLADPHLAAIEGAREENILVLQNYFKSDEMFLEVFEDEYLEMSAAKPMSIEHLMMDSNLLLPPAGSPLTGISFDKRLPCGEVERSRRAMRVYFLLRNLSLTLRNEAETYLPLTNTQTCVHIEENLDLTNSDMLACTVITRENVKTRRFLVIDVFQLILVEPSHKQMGWGVAKFVGFLQDIEVLGDKDDSRCLHITVKSSPTSQRGSQSKTPLLSAKFLFDDHIRCMAAKQRLVKGKQKARQRKLHMIAKMLDLTGTSPSPPQILRKPNRRPLTRSDRPLFNHTSKTLPGLAMAVVTKQPIATSAEHKSRRKSREGSPTVLRISEEEIPLGNIRIGKGHLSRNSSGSSQSTSSSAQVNHSLGLGVGLNFPLNSSESTTITRVTPEIINNRVDSVDAPLTPQSETSFMTVASTSSTNKSTSLYNNSNSNDFSQGVKKKKGAIETV